MTIQWPGIKIFEKVNHFIPQWDCWKAENFVKLVEN